MKKALMATTALVAFGALIASPAMAEERIKLSVGGYYQSFFSVVDQDVTGGVPSYNETNVRQEGEIHFKGSTTLDNGLTIGFQAQLEAVAQGDQIDESYLYFQGDFGRVVMGGENSAAYAMQYTAPSAGLGINSPNFFLFSPQGTQGTGSFINNVSDANKVTYFSPRFSGFQLGLSYTPNIDVRGGDRQTFGLNTDNDAGEQNNIFSVGANFVESFNGVDVAVAGGYERGALEANAAGAFDDLEVWSAGVNIGTAGYTVGGSYLRSNNGVSTSLDSTVWDVGVSYSTGPMGFSFMYLHSERDLAISEDEHDQFELGVSYALGPGISVVGSLQYFDEDAPSANNSDGWGAAIGTKLSF